LIFSTYSLTSVAKIAAYVLRGGSAIGFGSVTMSKSKSEEGIGGKVEGEEKLGKECSQTSFTKSSHIQIFFSHVKQRPLASNL
jgi:hypothetical protein